jgi:hypothetical protein
VRLSFTPRTLATSLLATRIVPAVVLGACVSALLPVGFAQTKAAQAQSSSSINYATAPDGAKTIEIQNVAYEVTNSPIPGRKPDERLVVRKTVHSKEVVGDIDLDAKVTVEAWPLGTDLRQKPLYAITETGTGAEVVEADLLVIDRRLEEVAWWTVHRLGTGLRLFDTYVPLVRFSTSRDTVTMRYAGLEVVPDDSPDGKRDKRLTEPHVVAVVSYASGDKLIREALLTADDTARATLLRSFADSSRTLSDIETLPETLPKTARDKNARPRHTLKLTISQDYPSPPNAIEILIPIVGDDLDLANAKLPPRIHLADWKR